MMYKNQQPHEGSKREEEEAGGAARRLKYWLVGRWQKFLAGRRNGVPGSALWGWVFSWRGVGALGRVVGSTCGFGDFRGWCERGRLD